jgi:hypothetical protein
VQIPSQNDQQEAVRSHKKSRLDHHQSKISQEEIPIAKISQT